MTALVRYEAACAALAEAVTVDEVKDILDWAEAARVYNRQAKNLDLEIQATEIRLRAERRLGQVLAQAKAAGQLAEGRPPKKNGANEEPFPRVTLAEVGVDKKLSARAQRVGGIAERAFEAMVERTRQRMRHGGERVSLDLLKEGDKKERRANRERVLAACQQNLPTQKYGVIYADPEWRFEVYSRETGMDRAADNHYPTSATDEICKRDVPSIAADDCVLFLWATVPMLPDALKVMEAWGFNYKSHCVWTKDKVGTGYWFRNSHELLLVGTKGNIPAPAMGTQWTSTVEGRVTKHSAKPERFYELIESYFPNLPKIELNARNVRKGWDAWGNEAPTDAAGHALDHDSDTGEIPATPPISTAAARSTPESQSVNCTAGKGT